MPTQPQPISLLVVDDDIAIREMVLEYLATRGYRVEGTSDGRVALELLKDGGYHCVLTDFQVPHADGLAIIRAARQHDPPLPIILITAYGTVETAVSALKEGATDFLLKPFRLKRLHEAIVQALERSRQARADARLGSTVALYDFAATVRTPWHLRTLLGQIAHRLELDLECDAAQILLETPGSGTWEALAAPDADARDAPEVLAGLSAAALAARLKTLEEGANLVTDAPAALFPDAAQGAEVPGWLASRPLRVELPGAQPRIVGAVVAARIGPPAHGADDGLSALARWANLAGVTVGRVWTLDPPVAGGPTAADPGA